MTDIDKRGHWEGDTFVLAEPLRIETVDGPPFIVHKIDFSVIILPEGITREETLEAMLDPAVVAYPLDEDDRRMYRSDPYAEMTDEEFGEAIPSSDA